LERAAGIHRLYIFLYPRARDRAVDAVDPIAEAGGEKPKKKNGSAARHHVGPERDAAAAPRACARNRGRMR